MEYKLQVHNGRAILTQEFCIQLVEYLRIHKNFVFSITQFTFQNHTTHFLPQNYIMRSYINGLISEKCKPLHFFVTVDNNTYEFTFNPFFIIDNINHWKDMSLELYDDYYKLNAEIILAINNSAKY